TGRQSRQVKSLEKKIGVSNHVSNQETKTTSAINTTFNTHPRPEDAIPTQDRKTKQTSEN
ncbi:14545_t:CDS:1, partial [Racocetra persica]